MKALGAAESRLGTFFLSESTALAVAGSLTGYVVAQSAQALSGAEIFGAAFEPVLS